LGYGEEVGDGYCFTAIERHTKLLLAWHLGKRGGYDTYQFTQKLKEATTGPFQLSTDAFKPHRTAVPNTLGDRVDFAQIMKIFGAVKGNEAAA